MVLLAPMPLASTTLGGGGGLSDRSPSGILLRRLQQIKGAGGDPGQAFVLHTSTGHVFRDEGRYAEAIKHYEAARDLATTELGGGARLVPALRELGFTRYRQGQLREARHELEAALVLGSSYPEHRVSVLQTLGNIRRDLGHTDDALKLYQQAWQECETDPRRHTDRQASLAVDMGDIYARLGDFGKAISYSNEALRQQESMAQRMRRQGLGASENLDLALTYCLMGGAYHMRGQVSKAMEWYEKALRMQAKGLRPGHTDLVGTQMSMSRAQRDVGDAEAALSTVEDVERALRDGGREGPDLSRALVLKADLLREAKRYSEAEATIEKALSLQVECFGGELFPEVAVALNCYESTLHDQGKFNEASDQYNKALQVNMRTVGLQHPETAATYNSLATLYQDAGQDDKALTYFTKCLEIQVKTVGNKSPDIGNTYNNLATILYRQGSKEDSANLFRQALEVMDNAGVPKTSPDRAVYADNLAMVLEELKADLVDIEFPPGSMGITYDAATGYVQEVKPGGMAMERGVMVGWVITAINGQPYTGKLKDEAASRNTSYTATFLKSS